MRCSLVVVLSDAPEQSLRCLTALAALSPDQPEHEVVVVDDASVGHAELLARLQGDVEIVRLARRSGWAAAARAGLERCSGDVAVLLRDAPELTPNALTPLVTAVERGDLHAATAVALGDPHPLSVGARVIAARCTDLAPPDAPPGLEMAALVAQLARAGAVEPVAASTLTGPSTRTTGARRAPGEPIELTVVIPTLDAASERVRRCVAAVQATTDGAHEIVVIDNGAPPQGFTAPVNAGLRAGRGDYLLVLNDDVELLPGWWAPLREALDAGASVVFPTTIDGAMRHDFAAWCFALTRETLETFAVADGEFLDPDLVVWYQDTDLLQRLRLAGRPPVHVDASRIRHGLSETVMSEDPALRAWIAQQVRADQAAFEARHGASVAGAAA